jgi:hypothetical protein
VGAAATGAGATRAVIPERYFQQYYFALRKNLWSYNTVVLEKKSVSRLIFRTGLKRIYPFHVKLTRFFQTLLFFKYFGAKVSQFFAKLAFSPFNESENLHKYRISAK